MALLLKPLLFLLVFAALVLAEQAGDQGGVVAVASVRAHQVQVGRLGVVADPW